MNYSTIAARYDIPEAPQTPEQVQARVARLEQHLHASESSFPKTMLLHENFWHRLLAISGYVALFQIALFIVFFFFGLVIGAAGGFGSGY